MINKIVVILILDVIIKITIVIIIDIIIAKTISLTTKTSIIKAYGTSVLNLSGYGNSKDCIKSGWCASCWWLRTSAYDVRSPGTILNAYFATTDGNFNFNYVGSAENGVRPAMWFKK